MKRFFGGILAASILFSISEAAPADSLSKTNRQVIINLENNSISFNHQKIQQNLIGEVTSIEPTAGKIVLKTEAGSSVTISTNDKTAFRRVLPGQTSLASAEQITFAQIQTGDRLLIPGGSANEQTPVRQIIVMAREAINAQRKQELETRRARTTAGRIMAIDPQTREITIQSRGRTAGANDSVTVVTPENVKFLRYAPDSLKVSNAVAGSFADLRVGDQIRILGDRSADGTRVTAEEVLSGKIMRTVGSIVDVNAASNEIIVKDSRTGQTLTVSLGKNTTLRRIPPDIAETLKQRINQRVERRRERANQQTAGNASEQQNERQNRRENRRQNRNAGGDRQQGQGRGFQQQFENLPAVTITELKKGDAVLITGTGGADNNRLTAVSVITGDADLQQILQRTQGGGNNQSPRSPGLPGDVSGGNSVNDNDEPRNQK